MFFKIAFAVWIFVGTCSANNPCEGSDKTIRNKTKRVVNNVEHCFFRLSDKDEKDSMTDAGETKVYQKENATRHCKRYKANLPQLTDAAIAKSFTEVINITCRECTVLLGLTVKELNATAVNVEWDTTRGRTIVTNTDIDVSTCANQKDMHMRATGYWYCHKEVSAKTVAVYCHHQGGPAAKTTKPAAATTTSNAPTRAASIEKVIALAALALIFSQMLPGRTDE